MRACDRLPPVLREVLTIGPGPQGPPQKLGQAFQAVDFRGGVAGLTLEIHAAPIGGGDVVQGATAGRGPALHHNGHTTAAGLGPDLGKGAQCHGSGLGEGMEGGAAQTHHKVGYLGGQGVALQGPQQGGGGGRRQGGHDRLAGGIGEGRPLGAGGDKGGRLRDVSGGVREVVGHRVRGNGYGVRGGNGPPRGGSVGRHCCGDSVDRDAAAVHVEAKGHRDAVGAAAGLTHGGGDLVAVEVDCSPGELDGAAAASGPAGPLQVGDGGLKLGNG